MQNNNPNPDGVAPSNSAESESQRKLSPEHRQTLEVESAIAPVVISERGYFTATDPAELEKLVSPSFREGCPPSSSQSTG
jgi:hypothetical protein